MPDHSRPATQSLWLWSLPAIAVGASVLLTVIYHPNDNRRAEVATAPVRHEIVIMGKRMTAQEKLDYDRLMASTARVQIIGRQFEAEE